MPREIMPGIHWIYEPGPDRSSMIEEGTMPDWYDPEESVHIPQCAYLLKGREQTLLFDTLSPASTENVLESMDEILDGGELDYLVVSHPDVPHAGNTHPILERHPGAELVAPRYGKGHDLYHLGDALKVGQGDSLDLGGLVAEFHRAPFLDAPISLWMTERTTNTLFPVDWLGYPNAEREILEFADEVKDGIGADRLFEFHARVLFWYQYVDVEKVSEEIDHLIDLFDPDVIAPAHGLVIREDATAYMEEMKSVIREIDQQGRIGTLG